MALVEGKEAEEVGSRASHGGAPFVLPSQGGSIVSGGEDAGGRGQGQGRGNIKLSNGARKFKVGVGEGAAGVGGRDDGRFNGGGEGLASKVGMGGVGGLGGLGGLGEEDPSHTGCGSIAGTSNIDWAGVGLADGSGAGVEGVCEPADVIKEIVMSLCVMNPGLEGVKGMLQETEQAPETCHTAEFAKDLVP